MHLTLKRAVVLAAAFLFAPVAFAGTISIGWTSVPYPNLVGYRVYLGSSAGNYTTTLDFPPTSLSTTLTGLADCTVHYVAVKSVDVNGETSPTYSNEIVGWPRPAAQQVEPQTVSAGTSVSVTVDGVNFQPGAVLESMDPGIVVDSAAVESCFSIRFDLSVAPNALSGLREFRVVNPDGVTGSFYLAVDGVEPEPGEELALYFDMDSPSVAGSQILDHSGQDLYATIIGATPALGQFGDGLRFGPKNDSRIVVDHDPSLHLGPAFTIAAWIRPSSFGENGSGSIVDKRLLSQAQGYALRLTSQGGLVFHGLWDQGLALSSPAIITLNKWQHVAVTYENGVLTFYRNGMPVGAHTALHDPRPANLKLLVGSSQGYKNDFDGVIDEVRIYRRALAQQELQLLLSPNPDNCIDQDTDGYGTALSTGCPPALPPDCDDSSAAVHPGAAEICGDGIDQNCDGADQECGACTDGDGDGYGTADSTGCAPGIPPDCDDASAAVHPGAAEICGDGIDQDCDGHDLACACIDADGDGYGPPGPDGCSPQLPPDCNDASYWVHPGALDVCGDGIDQNCDGQDQACTCSDADKDGYAKASCGGLDCDDDDGGVYPNAPEVCDGKDNDCDGSVDEDDVCVAPPPDAVAYWSMDADTVFGSALFDVSGNGHDGVIFGATLEPGRTGEALRFVNGQNDYVIVFDDDALDLGASFTISAWIYAETFGQSLSGAILDKWYAPTGEGFRLSLTNVGSYSGVTFHGVAGQALVYSLPLVIELRKWQHVAMVYNAPQLRFYVDGVQVGSFASYNDARPTFRDLYIGNEQGRGRDFDGLIDDVAIFDRALSPDELETVAGGFDP